MLLGATCIKDARKFVGEIELRLDWLYFYFILGLIGSDFNNVVYLRALPYFQKEFFSKPQTLDLKKYFSLQKC